MKLFYSSGFLASLTLMLGFIYQPILAYAEPETPEVEASAQAKTTQGDANTLYVMGLKCITGHGESRKDYKQARFFMEQAAQQGLPKAQVMYATLLYEGLGGEQDFAGARKWFTQAANKNQPSAQFFMGVMEQLGKGAPANEAKAAQWYEKAAKQGHVRANVALGMLYASGKGIKTDFAKARQYFEYAALRGHNVAQLKLGLMYKLGFGTAIDLPRGYAWLEIAKAGGNTKAATFAGNNFKPALKPGQVTEAKALEEKLLSQIKVHQAEKEVL
jgi:uncharacterized protein